MVKAKAKLHNRGITAICLLYILLLSATLVLICGIVISGACGKNATPDTVPDLAMLIADDEEEPICMEEYVPDRNAIIPAYELSAEDRDLVERIVAAESRGESLEGQMAVAQVIYCRAVLWGKSVKEVCLAKGQFAKPYKGTVPQKTKEAVENVFTYGDFPIDGNVTHFYAHKICSPKWAKKKVFMARIGNHTFMA